MKSNNLNQKKDLKKRSYLFALSIIKFIDKLNKKDLTVQVVSRQLIRCATSIGANIIEAQAGRSRKDFTNFFTHSLKSANETKFWISLLKDSKKAPLEESNILFKEVSEISNILGSSILTLKGKRKI